MFPEPERLGKRLRGRETVTYWSAVPPFFGNPFKGFKGTAEKIRKQVLCFAAAGFVCCFSSPPIPSVLKKIRISEKSQIWILCHYWDLGFFLRNSDIVCVWGGVPIDLNKKKRKKLHTPILYLSLSLVGWRLCASESFFLNTTIQAEYNTNFIKRLIFKRSSKGI